MLRHGLDVLLAISIILFVFSVRAGAFVRLDLISDLVRMLSVASLRLIHHPGNLLLLKLGCTKKVEVLTRGVSDWTMRS